MSFIPMKRTRLWCPIIKRKEIIMWIRVWSNSQTNFNSKNGWKRSFSYETKTSMSFIPMRKISLWFPIMKRKQIIMWIRVCSIINRRILFLKNGGKKSISYESKASMSFTLMKRTSLWCQSRKEGRLLCESIFIPIHKWTLTPKIGRREACLMKSKHKCHLSQLKERV